MNERGEELYKRGGWGETKLRRTIITTAIVIVIMFVHVKMVMLMQITLKKHIHTYMHCVLRPACLVVQM